MKAIEVNTSEELGKFIGRTLLDYSDKKISYNEAVVSFGEMFVRMYELAKKEIPETPEISTAPNYHNLGFNFRKEFINKDRNMERTMFYSSEKWFCSDGDSAGLYIESDNKGVGSGFELTCLSGIPESKIIVGQLDFAVLWKKAGYNHLPNSYDFNTQCFMLADYLCSLFCEEINTTEYKKGN